MPVAHIPVHIGRNVRWIAILLALAASLRITPRSLFAQDYPITPIPVIQGDDLATPLNEKWVDTVGVVTGVTPTGLYLQDPVGDGDPQTSDGIFVYTRNRPSVRTGDCVLIQGGYVSEFYEKTELSRVKGVRQSNDCPVSTVTPVPVTLPGLYSDPVALLERLEGMLVEVVDLEGQVHGPIRRYEGGDAEFALLPGDLSAFTSGGRVFHDEPHELSGLVYVSGALGARLPDLDWGDRVAVGRITGDERRVRGVLDYNFGKYQFIPLPQEPVQVEKHHPPSPVEAQPPGQDEFTICTFNLWGMGTGSEQYPDPAEYQLQMGRRAQVIANELAGCTIIGLQETGAPEDAANLAALLREDFGLDYAAWAFPGPESDNPEFPLTNSFLTRNDRVVVDNAELRQGCSPTNYQVPATPGHCPFGQYDLHGRPPLVIDATVSGDWGEPYPIRVISNHWKSKAGDERVNVLRRIAQARHVAGLVQETLDTDPSAHVVVLGDLNDYFVSEPVTALRDGVQPPLFHTYDLLPALNRYTYIFNGGSQVLDHILATESMLPALAEVRPIRISADFAESEFVDPSPSARHVSDHDPVLLRVRPDGVASLGGDVGFGGVTIELVDDASVMQASGVSDDQGEFRLWDIPPGHWTVRLTPPDGVELAPHTLKMDLPANPAMLPNIDARHRSIEASAAAALLAPALLAANR